MINIHIFKTDRPTRLHGYAYGELGLSKKHLPWKEGRNIYITSDEEVNRYDYYINNNECIQAMLVPVTSKCKKIILTTDQDLIENGVQAIDDEFLEWFVKNPSCEEVEVFQEIHHFGEVVDESYPEGFFDYKIIIPKEEPKQNKTCILCDGTGETTFSGTYNSQRKCDVCNGKGYIGLDVIKQAKDDLQLIKSLQETKQETIQEVELAILFHNTYEKLAPSFGYETRLDTKSFETTTPNGKLMIAVCKEIIKWQKEQDKNKYSEEEVIELLTKRCEFLGTSLSPFNELLLKQDLEWFNEFKKL